jgi:hypothetical protein
MTMKSEVAKKVSAAVCAVLVLAGCSQATSPEAVHPVSWYVSHDAERTARLQRCKDNDGTEGGSPSCMNAQAALRELQGRVNQKSVADGIKLK